MPAKRRSLAVTAAYRRRLIELRDVTARVVGDRWSLVDWAALDSTFQAWLRAATIAISGAQRETVRASDAYLAAFVSSELDEAVPPQGLDAGAYSGRTRDGRPIGAVLLPALYQVKLAILKKMPRERALASGLARAVRATRTEVMEASRSSLADAMAAEPRVKGYRRVTHSRPCGACIALAGGLRRTNKHLEIHPSCRCTAEPVVAGATEQFARPSGRDMFDALSVDEQNGLFAGTGGEAKAELIRSGKVDLSDLVARQDHPDWPQTITERPLAELTAELT